MIRPSVLGEPLDDILQEPMPVEEPLEYAIQATASVWEPLEQVHYVVSGDVNFDSFGMAPWDAGGIHKVPLSVKAANLAKYFPAWTVTRDQWADMLMPCISGVAIDTLLFSRIGSPLCHRYRLISRTRSHAAFRGTYLRRLRAFIDESDAAVGRWLHRWLAQEMAARVAKSTDSPASGHPRSLASHRTVSRPRRPRRLKGVASLAGGPESSGRLMAEMSSVQALMDLVLPRFAMAEGPRQVHPPWSVKYESPASPARARSSHTEERTPTVRWTRHRFRRCSSIWTHFRHHQTRSHWM